MNAKISRYVWILLILLAAATLRLHDIAEIPPGTTHDEADHGVDAWGVVNGERPLYFTVGYGREPLYDYSTALLMSFMGPTFLAGRLTSVFFSLVLIAGMYAWVRRAFGLQTALLTAAGLAVSFWPVMIGRHALRTVTMPALFVLAVLLFWHAFSAGPSHSFRRRYAGYLGAGLILGATFYTYIPARVLWAIFPALLLFLAVSDRPALSRTWRGTLLMLGIAALIAAPLFMYLYTHPQAEVRLDQLAGPVTAALDGNLDPLLQNSLSGLATLTVTGDSQWRYNIAGRPFLPPVMGFLFYAGLALALYRLLICIFRRRARGPAEACSQAAALFLALIWLVLGLLPVLITGAELSITQAVGMLPVLYLFPALALFAAYEWLKVRAPHRLRRWAPLFAVLLFALTGAQTAQAYFGEWANRPEVRTQYETTLVTAVDYLNKNGAGPVAISSATPNRFHDPATAAMRLTNEAVHLRWFDGRSSLLLPQDGMSRLVFSGHSALHPELAPYLTDAELEVVLPLLDDDENRPVTIYTLDGPGILDAVYPDFQTTVPNLSDEARFGEGATLLGYRLADSRAKPGEVFRLLTLWRAEEPVPAETVFFTHIVGADGLPIAQADRLDVPSYYWRPGDVFIQLHEITLPAGMATGDYPVVVGIYARSDAKRWPITLNDQPVGDSLPLTTLTIE